MLLFYNIIVFLIIAWTGTLLHLETKLKEWQILITLTIIGVVLVFIGIMLTNNGLM